jgi:hypothetical protein
VKYILLRVNNDAEAQRLIEDATEYPDSPLLTPCQENPVHAEVVQVENESGVFETLPTRKAR